MKEQLKRRCTGEQQHQIRCKLPTEHQHDLWGPIDKINKKSRDSGEDQTVTQKQKLLSIAVQNRATNCNISMTSGKKDTTPAPTPRPQKQIVGNIVEIDLHCHELLETTAGMNNKDILEYQLEVFRKTMEEYKLRKGQKIIFIHGKGDGILRQRILWELQTKYKRHHHQDASFKQYGYGATMVTIK